MENPLARVTRSAQVIAQLGLGTGARVADVGCGPGRVTLPLGHAVGPTGKVVALDLQAEMLAKLTAKAALQRLTNIQPVCGDARERLLPEASLDGAVMVMALGEMPEPPRVIAQVYAALKPGGRLLMAESVFDPHFLRRKRVTAWAVAAGFVEQSCIGNGLAYTIVFTKPGRS